MKSSNPPASPTGLPGWPGRWRMREGQFPACRSLQANRPRHNQEATMVDVPNSGATGGVKYATRDKDYFEKRGLSRYAGIWSLWALGVGAVISGHFSGWNFGFATGGWGGMLVAGIIIAIMYLG